MSRVQIHDKHFETYLNATEIQQAVERIAAQINEDLQGERPLFVGVLNGAFLFAADLLKCINIDCEISFVKVASYEGTTTTGTVKELVGLQDDIQGRTVVVLEDIVDTGITMDSILQTLQSQSPKQVKVATLLYKPEAFQKDFAIDYVAFEIPNEFVVGYGLDYDGLGRNLNEIYKITD